MKNGNPPSPPFRKGGFGGIRLNLFYLKNPYLPIPMVVKRPSGNDGSDAPTLELVS